MTGDIAECATAVPTRISRSVNQLRLLFTRTSEVDPRLMLANAFWTNNYTCDIGSHPRRSLLRCPTGSIRIRKSIAEVFIIGINSQSSKYDNTHSHLHLGAVRRSRKPGRRVRSTGRMQMASSIHVGPEKGSPVVDFTQSHGVSLSVNTTSFRIGSSRCNSFLQRRSVS